MFKQNFHNFLIKTNFQTSIHTWYASIINQTPKKFSACIDGLGDALTKSGYYMSKKIVKLAQKKKRKKLTKALAIFYKTILMDRLTNGEELAMFMPEVQQRIKKRQTHNFSAELSRYPLTSNLPLLFTMNARFKRLIGPSVFQLLSHRFVVFSPFLAKDVSKALLEIPLHQKLNYKFIKKYFKARLGPSSKIP